MGWTRDHDRASGLTRSLRREVTEQPRDGVRTRNSSPGTPPRRSVGTNQEYDVHTGKQYAVREPYKVKEPPRLGLSAYQDTEEVPGWSPTVSVRAGRPTSWGSWG